MAPRNSKSSEVSSQKETVELDSREVKLWTLEWVQLAIFICSFGVKTEIDIDGRKVEVFCVEGFNARGFKYVITIWGTEAALFEEYFRTNFSSSGQIFKFPRPDRFMNSEMCFRLRRANAYQKRFYDADFCLNLQVGEGEKMNFKKPAKSSSACLPVPIDDLDEDDVYEMEYFLVDEDEESVREVMPTPNLWQHKLHSSSNIPQELIKSPVKKRSFEELCRSPVKVETGAPSFVSPAYSKPLFNNPKK